MTDVTQSAPELRIWKLTLAYDGTDFHGWQVQPGETTVQGELQSAIARVTGESPLPQGSGRTDAGVHALAQVASFSLSAPIPAENLQRALNRTLPAVSLSLSLSRRRHPWQHRDRAAGSRQGQGGLLERCHVRAANIEGHHCPD